LRRLRQPGFQIVIGDAESDFDLVIGHGGSNKKRRHEGA
jgi:hypothetical protein